MSFRNFTPRHGPTVIVLAALFPLGLAAGCVLPSFDEVARSDGGAEGAIAPPAGTGGTATGGASASEGGAGGSASNSADDSGTAAGGSGGTSAQATSQDAGEMDGAEVACQKGPCNGNCPKKCAGEACTVGSECLSELCYRVSHTCASGDPPPSCSGGLTCADGLSCCDRSAVVGGKFLMGRSDFGNDACPTGSTCGLYEQPEHPVTVSSFALDTFEITVGRFRKFIEFLANNPGWQPAKGAGAHPLIANTGWNQGGWSVVFPGVSELRRQLKCDSNYSVWTDAEGADENRPITCINWYEAFAFCAWDGGRLPTEAEWEYAATGGDDNRPYPWGNQEPDCTYATFYNGYSCAGGSRLTSTVGSTPKGNGRWGQRDLAGNVWEWVLDTASIYSAAEYTDWANLTLGNMRVMRSGDAASIHPGSSWIRSTRRYGYDYATPSATLGSRCAREP